jgi:hypothetical protein
MRLPLARDLMGVGADVECKNPVPRQRTAYRVDRGMRGE